MECYEDFYIQKRKENLKFAASLAAIFVAIVIALALLAVKAQADVVSVARAEIGKGELGWDNFGPDVLKYTKGKPVSWCAGFVSYVLTESGADFDYTLSAREIFNRANNSGDVVKDPRPGDIIVFWRGKPNGWQGHAGIVEKVDGEKIVTIEGNVGDYPAKVRRFEYQKNNIPKLLGFVRVNQSNVEKYARLTK